VSGQLQERRAGGWELQILGDATEKLRAPNAVRANETVSNNMNFRNDTDGRIISVQCTPRY